MINVRVKKYPFMITAVICCIFIGSGKLLGQVEPPTPTALQDVGQGPGSPCDRTDHPGQGNGAAPPPPPGLCLPINDYLIPMLTAGIIFGAYKVRNLNRSSTVG